MAGETISANMLLPIPGVGVTDGPDWASDINACLNLIDIHDHTTGAGAPIPARALDLNDDVSLQGNDLILVRSTRYDPQASLLAGALDLGCVYVSGVDLYFNDVDGNQIRMTASGAVAGTPGSIANLVSPASATYVVADGTFVWEQDATVPANMDCGSIILRNLTAGAEGITISPPNSLGSSYALVLPPLPVAQKFMTLDASGNITASWSVDNSTLEVSSNILRVKSAGITISNMAVNSVDTPQLVDLSVTRNKQAAVGQQISSSTGTFNTGNTSFVDVTNATITITTTGRPVKLIVQPDGTSNGCRIGSTTGSEGVAYRFMRGSTEIAVFFANTSFSPNLINIEYTDIPVAGTYTYKLQAKASGGGAGGVNVNNAKLLALEY